GSGVPPVDVQARVFSTLARSAARDNDPDRSTWARQSQRDDPGSRRRQGIADRGARTDHQQDRWGSPVCRRAHEDGAESGLLRDAGDRYITVGPLRDFAIPTTLHDSLMARLDRLSAIKEVAQIGAAIGREFTYRLLAAVAPISGSALQSALEQLT